MGVVSLVSQSRCLKRAIVTVCPCEALSAGIFELSLQTGKERIKKLPAWGRKQTSLSNEEEFLSSYKSGPLKFMTTFQY